MYIEIQTDDNHLIEINPNFKEPIIDCASAIPDFAMSEQIINAAIYLLKSVNEEDIKTYLQKEQSKEAIRYFCKFYFK